MEVSKPFQFNIFRFGTAGRKDMKKMSQHWPGPDKYDLPEHTTNGRKTKFPDRIEDPKVLKELRDRIYKKDDSIGPDQYHVKIPTSAPVYSFGSRFGSSIRNKDHLRPQKVDGPGPGAYKLPSSVKTNMKDRVRGPTQTTFGTAGRNFVDLP